MRMTINKYEMNTSESYPYNRYMAQALYLSTFLESRSNRIHRVIFTIKSAFFRTVSIHWYEKDASPGWGRAFFVLIGRGISAGCIYVRS